MGLVVVVLRRESETSEVERVQNLWGRHVGIVDRPVVQRVNEHLLELAKSSGVLLGPQEVHEVEVLPVVLGPVRGEQSLHQCREIGKRRARPDPKGVGACQPAGQRLVLRRARNSSQQITADIEAEGSEG